MANGNAKANRKLPFIILIILSLVSLSLFLFYSSGIETDTPESTPPPQIPAPTTDAVRTFFEGNTYIDRISQIESSQKETLLRFINDYQVCFNLKREEILPPMWETGKREAQVPCRVFDFPKKGTLGMVNLKLVYKNEQWVLDLFGSESRKIIFILNVHDHPVGLLLAYFNTDEARLRSMFLLETALNTNRIAASTFPLQRVPWLEDSVSGIRSLTYDGKFCTATIDLLGYKGNVHCEEMSLRNVFGKWYVLAKPDRNSDATNP